MQKHKSPQIPLVHALAWIVGSALMVSASAHLGIQYYFKEHQAVQYVIRTLIQTGPQKQALKTEYLAQLLGLSADRPPLASQFDLSQAKERLLACPLIADAHVKLIKPETLYVDYTVRKPVAWLLDYENVVLDRSGYLFPFRPFFSPKNLPEIYIGLGDFGIADVKTAATKQTKPIAQWNTPLTGEYMKLALTLLNFLTDNHIQELFTLKRIDVSSAYSESYGTREIVVIVEDQLVVQKEGKEVNYFFPKILRLSTKNYAAELGNYLKLREKLVEQELKGLIDQGFEVAQTHNPGRMTQVIRSPARVFDFRIPNLAFI